MSSVAFLILLNHTESHASPSHPSSETLVTTIKYLLFHSLKLNLSILPKIKIKSLKVI